MKTERECLIENLEIIGDEYELNDWLESMLYKIGVRELQELEPEMAKKCGRLVDKTDGQSLFCCAGATNVCLTG
jgi:hypothetical protein